MTGDLLSLAALVASMGIGAWIGDLASKKTGRKSVGWPVGIVTFLALFATASVLLP